MIYEISYWQRDLARAATILRRHVAQRRWSDRSNASVEKFVILGFYTVRKMLDAFQPPPGIPGHVRVTSFPHKGKRLSQIVWPDVAEAFDLTKPASERITVRELCNQAVHTCAEVPDTLKGGRPCYY